MRETLTVVLITAAFWLVIFAAVAAMPSMRTHRLLRRNPARAAKKPASRRQPLRRAAYNMWRENLKRHNAAIYKYNFLRLENC